MKEDNLKGVSNLQKDTAHMLERHGVNSPSERWQRIAKEALWEHRKRTKLQCQDSLAIANTEHMSLVDCFNGADHRIGQNVVQNARLRHSPRLPTISPRVDDRLYDAGRRGVMP